MLKCNLSEKAKLKLFGLKKFVTSTDESKRDTKRYEK
jgi:hypothetical protein